jgi:hypothetical protein
MTEISHREALMTFWGSYNVKDYGALGTGAVDDSSAIQAAIDAVDTTGGRGGVVLIPTGVYRLDATLDLRDHVSIVGSGVRASLLSYTGNGPAISVLGRSEAGVKNLRLQLATSSATACCIDVSAYEPPAPPPTPPPSPRSTLLCQFSNLELAGNANTGGQVGINLSVVDATHGIVSDCIFDRIRFIEIARPVVDVNSEGNFWMGCIISRFGSGAGSVALDCQGTHANFYDFRVAGVAVGVSGQTGYQQTGSTNHARLVCDHGGAALNVTGDFNIVEVSRPEGLTPLGAFSNKSTIVDAESATFVKRVCAGGTPLTAANFSLSSGWGSSAFVDDVTGTDQRMSFRVNSRGTGQTADPYIDMTFADGAWPTVPFGVFARTRGNQIAVQLIWVFGSTSTCEIHFLGTPVDLESYEIMGVIMG